MPLNINSIGHGQYPNNRQNFDALNGFSSTDLSLDEINRIRPIGLEWLSHNTDNTLFFKTHAAYTHNPDQTPVLGSTKTGIAGALYFVRNPLDVCVSYAHHSGVPIDYIINIMASNSHKSHPQNLNVFIPEEVLSWSGHVNSWTNTKDIPVMTIRYEDMLDQPKTTFSKACDFLQLGVDSAAIEQALDNCRFKQLQSMEQDAGFIEKPKQSKRFFRKGIAGDWKNVLTSTQIQNVIDIHSNIMHRFNYLDEKGNPCVD